MINVFNYSFRENDENDESSKSDTESFAEVSESDLIALALSPNGDEDGPKISSLPSDSTLNSVSLADVDGAQGSFFLFNNFLIICYYYFFHKSFSIRTSRRESKVSGVYTKIFEFI